VASGNTVRILVNDEFFIPQSGLLTPASVYGTVSGPFDLVENENLLTVETPLGSQTVVFPVTGTSRISSEEAVKIMLTQGFDVALVSQLNGHLFFTETSRVGPTSFLRVRGSAAGALGFGSPENGRQWGALGRQIYPSWGLYLRPDTITNRFPRFNEVIRGNPVFKVTYTVPPQRCLRCGGSYIENDLRYNETGQNVLIENEDLLYQACLKLLLTDRGSNAYHPWYGTTIRDRIGSKALGTVAALISEDVRQSLAKLQALQQSQAKYQQVTFRERIYSVLSVRVSPHSQDQTTFLIDVVVQNASSEPIELSIVFTVPSVVALMGSNGLMLDGNRSGLTRGTTQSLFSSLNPLALTDGT
jgi:phage baseplate assembly protein W